MLNVQGIVYLLDLAPEFAQLFYSSSLGAQCFEFSLYGFDLLGVVTDLKGVNQTQGLMSGTPDSFLTLTECDQMYGRSATTPYLVSRCLQILDAGQQKVRGGLIFLQKVEVTGAACCCGTEQESEDTSSRTSEKCKGPLVNCLRKMYFLVVTFRLTPDPVKCNPCDPTKPRISIVLVVSHWIAAAMVRPDVIQSVVRTPLDII